MSTKVEAASSSAGQVQASASTSPATAVSKAGDLASEFAAMLSKIEQKAAAAATGGAATQEKAVNTGQAAPQQAGNGKRKPPAVAKLVVQQAVKTEPTAPNKPAIAKTVNA